MISKDLVPALISLVLFFALIAPFVYYILKNKKKEKLLIQKIQEAARQSGAKLEKTESWRQLYALGLDPVNKLLVYWIDGENPLTISLYDVRKITVNKKTQAVQGSEKREIIDFIGLELQHTSGKKATILEFYNEERFSDLSGEILMAENWTELLNKYL